MYYHEHSHSPEQRTGLMIPRSALPDFFKLPDSGFCSLYAFTAEAKFAIGAQGNAQGLSRFPVYSDRLWIDIDAADSSEAEKTKTQEYTRELTRQFRALDYHFTVWDSGSKGFHIGIRIEPMFGKDVPWSQMSYLKSLGIVCDYSLYQHARLFRNPGCINQKTGRKKTKVFEHQGQTVLTIPLVAAPERLQLDSETLTDSDLGRIALNRLQSLILDAPLPGQRHTQLWSTASQCIEAGLASTTVKDLLLWVNKMNPTPKDDSEVIRAVDQAAHQLGVG